MSFSISKLCDKIIEAGWLLALILAPLFFNIYSSRVFEPDKAGLVRSIALIMVGAWLLKLLDGALRTNQRTPGSAGQRIGKLLRTPLVLPTLLLIVAYLISTAFSVAPRLSLGGSYERGQGTYTLLSYIVIFASILGFLRRREQLDRLMYAVVLTSIPAALYGLLQRHGLDPLPWLGNVSTRVAGSQGNAIFLSAYLILAFFLTLDQALAALMRLQSNPAAAEADPHRGGRVGIWLLFGLLLGGASLIVWEASITAGLVLLVLAPPAAVALARITRVPLRPGMLFALYVPVLGLQALCIYYTGSRGPWLGLLGGLYLFGFLGLIMLRRQAGRLAGLPSWEQGLLRWLWLAPVLLALAFGLFLVGLNAPNSPLAPLRSLPGVGRLGSIVNLDEGTNKVRVLIWGGSIKMIAPHPPLAYPDGSVDTWNAIRPLVGYGPEAMWVAYNRFYPPDLAHYEARNASPDRSHNETLDALGMTGALGFLAYMALFLSAFYYAFHWLGLLGSPADRARFIILSLVGACGGVLAVWLADRSLRLAGVGLPLGLSAGVILYATWSALREDRDQRIALNGRSSLLVLALLSLIMAHFIEIHFGIAIVATRLYFWIAAALLVLAGTGQIQEPSPAGIAIPSTTLPAARPEVKPGPARHSSRRKTKSTRTQAGKGRPAPATAGRKRTAAGGSAAGGQPGRVMERLLPYALILAAVLITLAYDFATNSAQLDDTFTIFWHALTTRSHGGQVITSYGILGLWLATWFVGALVAIGEDRSSSGQGRANRANTGDWAGQLIVFSSIALGGGLLYGLLHSARLRPGGNVVAGYSTYAVVIAIVMLLLAFSLMHHRSAGGKKQGQPGGSPWTLVALPGIVLVVWLLILGTNVRPVQADTYYKQGMASESSGWDTSIALYRKALELTPDQDRYYLFLGRAELEKAKSTSDAQERELAFQAALKALTRAREISPLNTDHTANMARLYRSWADFSDNDQTRQERLGEASKYYKEATILSPHNAQLLNEWGIVYTMMGKPDEALARYQESLVLDPRFPQTYLLMGDLYLNQKKYDQALQVYTQALAINPKLPQAHSARGYIYSQQGKTQEAITDNLEVLQLTPNDFATQKNLAILYNQAGQSAEALKMARQALQHAPEKEKGALEAMVTQLQQSSGEQPATAQSLQDLLAQGVALFNEKKWDEAAKVYKQALELDPDSVEAHTALGYIAFQQGDLATAERHNLRIIELTPNDYNAHKNLALVYQQMGQPEKALAQAETALSLAPEKERSALEAFIKQLQQAAGE